MAEQTDTNIFQSLAFTLGNETFAIEVAHVREVLAIIPVTHLPDAPAHVKGVINVRGSVVPVVDLRTKLGMPVTEQTVQSAIIVSEMGDSESGSTVGFLVDAVQEVLDLDMARIEPPPDMARTGSVSGICPHNGTFILVLDIRRLLDGGRLNARGSPLPATA